MKKILFLALVATMTLGFTACSDDDDDNKKDGNLYSQNFFIRFENDEEDSLELAIVRQAYAEATNCPDTADYQILGLTSSDSATCVESLKSIMKQAEAKLESKSQQFSSHPFVRAWNESDSVVYEAQYGNEENGIKNVVGSSSVYRNCMGTIEEEFAGYIKYGTSPSEYESRRVVQSPDLNATTGSLSLYVYMFANNDYKNVSNADGTTWYTTSVTYTPITDVVVWDARESGVSQQDVPTSMEYNDHYYELVGTDGKCTTSKGMFRTHYGHELYIYVSHDVGFGKRMMVNGMFTGYRKQGHMHWGFPDTYYEILYYTANADDFQSDSKIRNFVNQGSDYKVVDVPTLATKNGVVTKISGTANINTGIDRCAPLYLMIGYRYGAGY